MNAIPRYSRVTNTVLLSPHPTHFYGIIRNSGRSGQGGCTAGFAICDSGSSANYKTLTTIHGMTKQTGVTLPYLILTHPMKLTNGLFVQRSDVLSGGTIVVLWG